MDPAALVATDSYLCALYEVAYSSISSVLHETDASNFQHIVEVGSGIGLSRTLRPEWIRSDVEAASGIALITDAEKLPFRPESVDALVMKDTWHHIADIEQFLRGAHGCLRPGGSIVVFDPYWGPLARFVYRFLHHERWDTRTRTWTFASDCPTDSNQALSFLMLRRDRSDFNRHWGDKFIITEHGRHIGPSFLLSGGVYRRTPISGKFLAHMLRWEESRGRWFDIFRFFHTFSMVKR